MCNSRYVSEHRIPAVPGFSSRFGARLSWLTYFVVLFRPPRNFPGGTAKCPRRSLFFLPTSSFRTTILSHAVIQNYSSVSRHHSELFFCPTPSFGTTHQSHIIIKNYSSVPRRHSEPFFRPMSLFRTILPSHVAIRNYSCVPRHHSELFLRPTSSFRTIILSHVVIRNYSGAPRHHSETILPFEDTLFPRRTHAHTRKE